MKITQRIGTRVLLILRECLEFVSAAGPEGWSRRDREVERPARESSQKSMEYEPDLFLRHEL